MFTYIDEKIVSEIFFESTNDIEYLFFALHSLDRMKSDHLNLLANNDDTIDAFLSKISEFYKNEGSKIPFLKPLNKITAEDVIKPFLEKIFLDLYQIAIIKDIEWKYKFINYNQLLSVAETTKSFNFGIDKIKIAPEHRKKYNSIKKLTSYTYWIIWSIFNATKYWASKVIPSKILFESNTYDNEGIPAYLCTIPFRTIIELANGIAKSNTIEIDNFHKKYPSNNFNSILTFAKAASNVPICLDPIYYMDDVKNSVNHGIVTTIKNKFKLSNLKPSELLPLVAAQTLVFYINGITIHSSLIETYDNLYWQTSKAAKKSIYENILNCFYFQDLFDYTAHFFKNPSWDKINQLPKAEIANLFVELKEQINTSFQGPLVDKWLNEVINKMGSEVFYESNLGLLSGTKGIGSLFVATESGYNEFIEISNNSLIVEDRISLMWL